MPIRRPESGLLEDLHLDVLALLVLLRAERAGLDGLEAPPADAEGRGRGEHEGQELRLRALREAPRAAAPRPANAATRGPGSRRRRKSGSTINC